MRNLPGLATIRRLRAWRGSSVVATALVVLIGVLVAARLVDADQLLASVRSADLRLLALAAVLYAMSWPIRGRRYDDVLDAMSGRIGLGFSTAIVFLSQTANLVVPARAGDGFRAYLLNRRRQVAYTTGVASLAVERLFDLLAITVLGGIAALWLVASGQSLALSGASTFVAGAAAVGAGTLSLGVLLGVLARSDRSFGQSIRGAISYPLLVPVVDSMVRFGADVRVVARSPLALARIGAGSLAIWSLDSLTAVLVLAALGGDLSPPALLAVGTLAVTVGNLAKVLPLSQGGIGLYEAAFTALVVATSPVAASTALAAAIVDHTLKNVVTLAGGALAALGLNVSVFSTRGGVQESDPEPTNY